MKEITTFTSPRIRCDNGAMKWDENGHPLGKDRQIPYFGGESNTEVIWQ